MNENSFEEMLVEYNRINNSFKKKCIYHVGIDAGFYSEVGAMLECMLYCYTKEIRFVLYADDSNFAGYKNGYEEFFEPFCEVSHNRLNSTGNYRYDFYYGIKYTIKNRILRLIEQADYLTADVFKECIPRERSTSLFVEWEYFNISGTIFDQFGKLGKLAMRYNDRTRMELMNCIESLDLPDQYISIQFRGGDKCLEFQELNDVSSAMDIVLNNNDGIVDVFILSDDYDYVSEVVEKFPGFRVYSFTGRDEHGYDNSEFNRLPWEQKRIRMIRLFAAVEICLNSEIHFGNEQTCLNNYVKSAKEKGKYICAIKD